MKKYLKLFMILLPFCTFALPVETDVSLYNQLTFVYNSSFYPGALQFAQRIISDYPDSFYSGEALLIKGECLVRLNQFENAEDVLKEAVRLNASSADKLAASYFWLARYYELNGENVLSLENYLNNMKFSENKYFSSAVLNSANVYVRAEDFKNAIPLYEYVLENGNLFSGQDYADSLLRLSHCYNRNGRAAETVKLYSLFSKDDFTKFGAASFAYYAFKVLAGEAYESEKQYKKAYDLYVEVLESGEKNLAAEGLKKAYLVSSNHRKEVGEEPGAVLANAQKTLAENPALLGEFWTRLGTDAFGEGDFKRSVSYFDEAEKNVPVDLFLYALLYRAQIAGGKNPDEKSAALAEKMILESRGILNAENESLWNRESFILLTRYAAIQKNWESVKKYGANVNPLDEDTRYFLALAYYSTGDYREANSLLKNQNLELHALSLARMGDLKNAAFVYNNIEANRPLTDEEQLNYSKVLLLSGRYREAQIEANKVINPVGKYILALAQFNTWSWSYAEESFQAFVKNPGSGSRNYLSYALFYLGYSQYRQGKTKEAYENLNAFVSKYPGHELYYNGQIASANSLVQNFRYDLAAKHGKEAVKAALTEEQKEESVLLLAEILSDGLKYDEAINLLKDYSGRNDDFGMKSLYQLAQLYEKQKMYEKADSTYKELSERFPEKRLAEEAMYRRGEVYYNGELFDKAVKAFEEYARKFPNGSFIDSSWYFSADSLAKAGKFDRAILQYQALLNKFDGSTYVYSSAKNLVLLYRSKADYEKAIKFADFLLEKFGEQAKNDGIERIALDLKSLYSGKTEEMVNKENEYKNFGGLSTAAGRKSGTDLVFLYASSSSYTEAAVTLARELLPEQEKNLNAESAFAAKNAEFLGKKYRESEKNKESAQMYLKAAEYYRMSGADDSAAASLYGSYDAFRASGLQADANETAKLLRKLYPESRQARNVKIQ